MHLLVFYSSSAASCSELVTQNSGMCWLHLQVAAGPNDQTFQKKKKELGTFDLQRKKKIQSFRLGSTDHFGLSDMEWLGFELLLASRQPIWKTVSHEHTCNWISSQICQKFQSIKVNCLTKSFPFVIVFVRPCWVRPFGYHQGSYCLTSGQHTSLLIVIVRLLIHKN